MKKTNLVKVYESDYTAFKNYCKTNGYTMVGLISVLIRKFIKTNSGGSGDDTIPKTDGK